MLNYVWITLIVIGILVAVGNDVKDEITNPYRNGIALEGTIVLQGVPPAGMMSWEGELSISAEAFNRFYATNEKEGIRLTVKILTGKDGESRIQIPVHDKTPAVWKHRAGYGLNADRLSGTLTSLRFTGQGSADVQFTLDPVRFVKLRAVTKAAFEYAANAVTIALGLIGIMALWLGVMKVAEEAGAVKVLTKLLAPVTRRLFPEIPTDHPAVGAMIMNISANMLGLSNAATPFGLKAMEELNKLNPKVGTATNAMCTFLAINTAGLVFIPATAMAVRAAAGSANPGLIIGTSIFGAACATVSGLIAVKVLQHLPIFRKDDPALAGKDVSNG